LRKIVRMTMSASAAERGRWEQILCLERFLVHFHEALLRANTSAKALFNESRLSRAKTI
jgi:hypothetical protein